MILSAPVPVGGYIRILDRHEFEIDYHTVDVKLTLRRVLTEPVVAAGMESSRSGARTVSWSDDEV